MNLKVGLFSPGAAFPATGLFVWAALWDPSSPPAADGFMVPDLDRLRDSDSLRGGPPSAPPPIPCAPCGSPADADAALAARTPWGYPEEAEDEEEEEEEAWVLLTVTARDGAGAW